MAPGRLLALAEGWNWFPERDQLDCVAKGARRDKPGKSIKPVAAKLSLIHISESCENRTRVLFCWLSMVSVL
jgi:hypothetical protein